MIHLLAFTQFFVREKIAFKDKRGNLYLQGITFYNLYKSVIPITKRWKNGFEESIGMRYGA